LDRELNREDRSASPVSQVRLEFVISAAKHIIHKAFCRSPGIGNARTIGLTGVTTEYSDQIRQQEWVFN